MIESGRSKRRPARAPIVLLTAVVVTALLAAACGSGGGSDGSDGSGGGSSGGGGGSGDLGTIKVIVSNQYDLAEPGVDAGLEYNTWKGTGLTVKQVIGEHGTDALAAGEADVTVGSPNRVIGPILQGLPVKLAGPTLPVWDQYIIVGTHGKYADAQKPADLKGAKFGISSFGSAGAYSAAKLAEQQGWSKSDYSTVTLGSLDGLIAGLKKGTIDAFAWSAITAYTIQEQGFGRVIGSFADIVDPPAPLDVLVVSDKAIQQRPKAVKAFCKGYYAAQTRLKEHPDETLKLFVDKWKVGPKKVVKEAMSTELPLLAEHGGFDEAHIKGMADTARKTTKNAKDITANQVKDMTVDCSSL